MSMTHHRYLASLRGHVSAVYQVESYCVCTIFALCVGIVL